MIGNAYTVRDLKAALAESLDDAPVYFAAWPIKRGATDLNKPEHGASFEAMPGALYIASPAPTQPEGSET